MESVLFGVSVVVQGTKLPLSIPTFHMARVLTDSLLIQLTASTLGKTAMDGGVAAQVTQQDAVPGSGFGLAFGE